MLISSASLLACCYFAIVSEPPPKSYSVPEKPFWQLVATSNRIVYGIPEVPTEKVRAAIASGRGNYVEISVKVTETLKGSDAGKTIRMRYFANEAPYLPSAESVIALNAKEAIFFLVEVDNEEGVTEYYFLHAPKHACQPFDSKLAEQIRNEVKHQNAILNDFPAWAPRDPKTFNSVKKLVNQLTKPEKKQQAMDQLSSLGSEAIPALVQFMDDFRPLPPGNVMVVNKSPNAFEAFAHYSPDTVVDALSIVLAGIAGESIGSIYNGGSESERRNVIDGWRVFLYYTDPGVKRVVEGERP